MDKENNPPTIGGNGDCHGPFHELAKRSRTTAPPSINPFERVLCETNRDLEIQTSGNVPKIKQKHSVLIQRIRFDSRQPT